MRASGPSVDLDRRIARLLAGGALVSVVLLALGVAAMAGAGLSPLQPSFPALDLARLPGDIAALRPEGFLWLGLLAVLGTPAARVLTSLLGFIGEGERRMTLIAAGVLAVIALSVIAGGVEG